MVLASPDTLYAFRDPNGIRPLCIGKLPEGRGWVVSSETCGLDIVGAEYVRDVEPGEIVRFNKEGVTSEQGVEPRKRASCIFEYVYFARPDSVMDGQSVYQARRNMGRILAQRGAGRRRPGARRARQRHPVGDGLRLRKRHPVLRRHREEPLRGPHVHPAHAGHATAGHPPEAQPAAFRYPRQAPGGHRRLHRARQHVEEAHARCCATPAPPRCTCASSAPRSCGRASTASTPTRATS